MTKSKTIFILLGIILAVSIGIIDYITRDYLLYAFYIIPVIVVAWFAGRNAGIFMAFISTLAVITLDIIETPHHTSFLVHYWNAFSTLGFFIIIVYFLIKLKHVLAKLEDAVARYKKTEKSLEIAAANYHSIFESANDAIIVRDIKEYRVVDANNKACETLCCTKKELYGAGIENIVADPSTFKRFKHFYDEAAKGASQIFEWLVKDRFGRQFWVEISIKRAMIGGQYQLVSIARDITERKELETAKENFMNTVSHELRTPLAAIKGGIDIAFDGLVGKIGKQEKECLEIAKRNVNRLSRLIDNVLDFQKIKSDKMPFKMEENDINEIVKDIQISMTPVANNKKLSLTVKIGDKMPRIIFDKDKIAEVLMNIANNAVKFTNEGSIAITTIAKGYYVTVSVEDTGIGIHKEDIPKLFKKFEQIERVGSLATGGTGLGLAISKEIIERHNGRIWAESELGKGTTVSFTLPVKEL